MPLAEPFLLVCLQDNALKHSLWNCFYIGRIPEAFSVIATLSIAVGVLVAIGVVLGNEIVTVTGDEKFQRELTVAKTEINEFLRLEHSVEIRELKTGLNETVQTYDIAEFAEVASVMLLPVNDVSCWSLSPLCPARPRLWVL